MNTEMIYTIKRRNVSPDNLAEMRERFFMKEYEPPIQYKNLSRYKNVRTTRDYLTGRLYHENINTPFIEKSKDDEYYTISKIEEGRLDIVSLECYQTPKFWWVLAVANYIIDPFDIPVGTVLRVPPIVSMYQSGGILSGH